MTDYTKLVEALQWCAKPIPCSKTECPRKNTDEDCACHVLQDAAAAIEDLQAEVERLEPKHGEWKETDMGWDGDTAWVCSVCGEPWMLIDGTPKENNMNFCPNCGAKMEVQE